MIQAIATAVPVLVAAVWLVRGVGMLWRRSLWDDAGSVLCELADATGGEVVPVWNGWAVASVNGRVELRGGLHGQLTCVKPSNGKGVKRKGLPKLEEILELLR